MSVGIYPRWDIPPILIVSGCHGATQRYRCFHHDEQLRLRGVESRVVMQWRPHLLRAGLGCGTVVLHRVAMDPAIESLVRQTRDSGGMVLFDIDDLVFDPEATQWHRGVQHLPADEQEAYFDGVARYRQTLKACDGVIVPTPFLARRVADLGKPVWISRNCLDLELTELSRRSGAADNSDPARVVVGYASGSRTHDWDFAEAAGSALRRIMERHPAVMLRTVGPVKLGDEWLPLADRVESLPAVEWRHLPQHISTFDINLAPLEINNPFCQAKSELKWLEAAACRVPTVASSTEAFETAVVDQTTGLLAGDVDEWEQALESLVTDPDWRRSLGQAAYEAAVPLRTTQGQASEYVNTLRSARSRLWPHQDPPPMPTLDGPEATATPDLTAGVVAPATGLRVNFLLPEPMKGSGGHGSIVRMAAGLAKRGHEVTVHVDPGPLFREGTDDELDRFMRRYFPPADVEYRLGREFEPADVAIATGWTTASAVANARNCRVGLYFVQDFEPYFQPMGPSYAAAESTYRLGLGHITLGPWLSELLRERYGARAQPIDFGLEPTVYRFGEGARKPQIVFYGRGTTPRRGTELGLQALRLVKSARPDVSVVLYGGDRIGDDADGFTHVGILTPAELADLYRESAVGLALSYTNMSFVPLELMSTGCAVVAVDAPPVEWCLRDGENAAVVQSSAESLASAMLRLLSDETERLRLVSAGRDAVAHLGWEHSADQFEEHVCHYASQPNGIRSHPPSSPTPRLASLKSDSADEHRLTDRVPVGWEIECELDGLHRIDVRLKGHELAPEGELALRVWCPFSGRELASCSRPAEDIITGEWLPLTFSPVQHSATRQLRADLSWSGSDSAPDVAVLTDGDGIPAHRSFALKPAPQPPDPTSGLLVHLQGLRRTRAQLRIARAALERERCYDAAKRWRAWMRPMPPPVLRPWPDETAILTKLRLALREYGPVPAVLEIGRFVRWRLGYREATQ